MQPGADFLDNEVGKGTGIVLPAIEQSGIGGADKGCGGAGGVLFIAGDEIVFFSLFPATFGTNDGAGIDKVFKRAIGADDGANVAPFHDEGGGEAKFALEINEVLAEFGQGRNWGDGSIHFGKAGMRGEISGSLPKGDFLAYNLHLEIYFLEKLFHAGAGGGVVASFQSEKSKSTIHSASIDVDVFEIVGDESGDSTFS